MFYVYILDSTSFNRYYIGHTNNVDSRVYRHNRGWVLSTKAYCPWQLVYKKEFTTRSSAMKYEYYLKSLKSREYLKKIIVAG